jgi:hypothetical protein
MVLPCIPALSAGLCFIIVFTYTPSRFIGKDALSAKSDVRVPEVPPGSPLAVGNNIVGNPHYPQIGGPTTGDPHGSTACNPQTGNPHHGTSLPC